MSDIKYLDLQAITAQHHDEITAAVQRVVDGGWYLHGKAYDDFTRHYAAFIGTNHCVGCANGLDALSLILQAYIEMGVMQKGDEVIVPANTFIASILAITRNGLVPVLIEPHLSTFQIDDRRIEEAITPRTRAIMIVHLYGRCAYTERIGELCKAHNLKLIEDNAQAHGCRCSTTTAAHHTHPRTGALGDAAAHSFYPGKNLGALGDGGAVTTDDADLTAMVNTLANYGSTGKYIFDYEGMNSRLDDIQAAVLNVKLNHLDDDNAARHAVATRYITEINNHAITVPTADYLTDNVFHIFPVMCDRRDALQRYLADNGVQTIIHYPIPPHRQQCYAANDGTTPLTAPKPLPVAPTPLPITERIHREELSLPCNQVMTEADITTVIQLINSFE